MKILIGFVAFAVSVQGHCAAFGYSAAKNISELCHMRLSEAVFINNGALNPKSQLTASCGFDGSYWIFGKQSVGHNYLAAAADIGAKSSLWLRMWPHLGKRVICTEGFAGHSCIKCRRLAKIFQYDGEHEYSVNFLEFRSTPENICAQLALGGMRGQSESQVGIKDSRDEPAYANHRQNYLGPTPVGLIFCGLRHAPLLAQIEYMVRPGIPGMGNCNYRGHQTWQSLRAALARTRIVVLRNRSPLRYLLACLWRVRCCTKQIWLPLSGIL